MKLSQAFALSAALLISGTSLAGDNDAITAARFSISIDGYSMSAKAFEGGSLATEKSTASSTPLKVVIDRTGSEPMWQWIAATFQNGPVKKKVEGQAKGKRRATFTGATITEVKFADLDAKDGKKHMDVTVTLVPERIAAAPEPKSPAVKPAPKSWHPANFRVKVGGLPLAKVTKIDAFTIKQKIKESGKPPVMVLDSARLTLDAADAKKLSDALAKDATQSLTIAFTNDDGSVWKSLVISGLTVVSTQAGKAGSNMTIKGSKILLN